MPRRPILPSGWALISANRETKRFCPPRQLNIPCEGKKYIDKVEAGDGVEAGDLGAEAARMEEDEAMALSSSSQDINKVFATRMES